MKTINAVLPAILFAGSLAFAGESNDVSPTANETNKSKNVEAIKINQTDPSDVRAGADNTGANKRDRKEGEPTADQQKNDKSDLSLTAQIRRSIMKDKSLSSSAHNVKIIARNGIVTLKGPVRSDAEKATIEQRASEIVGGQSKVKSEIEIKP